MLHRRRFLTTTSSGLALGAVALLLGRGALAQPSYTVPLAQLQEMVAPKFPRSVPVQGLFDLTLQVPLLRLLPAHSTLIDGQILFNGQDLARLPDSGMRAIRGRDIAMIFQEPMTSLNPCFTVGFQIMETLKVHEGGSRTQRRDRTVELLGLVGIPAPETRLSAFPHQLSGGMCQRVMIAMAIACNPRLLIADEPTTALDVTIQAQILELLRGLQAELGMSILLITHDLGVVAETCAEVIVMYAGRVVEQAPTAALFARPRHHYTAGLLRSVPSYQPAGAAAATPYRDGAAPARARLTEIAGVVPPLHALPKGCKFVDRCGAAIDRCRTEEPALVAIGEPGDRHRVRCHVPVEVPT